jgi:hypothetical protein
LRNANALIDKWSASAVEIKLIRLHPTRMENVSPRSGRRYKMTDDDDDDNSNNNNNNNNNITEGTGIR